MVPGNITAQCCYQRIYTLDECILQCLWTVSGNVSALTWISIEWNFNCYGDSTGMISQLPQNTELEIRRKSQTKKAGTDSLTYVGQEFRICQKDHHIFFETESVVIAWIKVRSQSGEFQAKRSWAPLFLLRNLFENHASFLFIKPVQWSQDCETWGCLARNSPNSHTATETELRRDVK